MVRIALLSDVHGHQVALDAALDHLRDQKVDRIICLGDVATLGPQPVEVLRRLGEVGCPCIMGNHDEFLLDPGLVRSYTSAPVVVESIDWCRDQLSQDDLAFLASFPRTLEVELGQGRVMLLCHGSPGSNTQDILATTPPDELDGLLGDLSPAILACGHTHIQMLRQHRGRLIVNPGSLGIPFREYVAGREPELMVHAELAVIEVTGEALSVSLRRLPLDRAALRRSLEGVGLPLRQNLRRLYD